MFSKEEIDKWLDKETKTKNERIKYDIWMEKLCKKE